MSLVKVESATCLTNMTTLDAWEWGKHGLDDFIVIALLRTNSEKTKLLCTKVILNSFASKQSTTTTHDLCLLWLTLFYRIKVAHHIYLVFASLLLVLLL